MKKLLLLFLTISFSIYPIIVQTVVLKNKETGKQVILYGDQSSWYGNHSVDEQLHCLDEKISLMSTTDINECLFLIKDDSANIIGKIHNDPLHVSELLCKLRKMLNVYYIQPKNVDILQVCMTLITYITSLELVEHSIKSVPALEGKSALEVIRTKPEDARRFDMLLQNLPLSINNMSDAYSMLYEMIKVIIEQLEDKYEEISQLSVHEKNKLFNTINTIIDNAFESKCITPFILSFQNSAGIFEMKTALEILSNRTKKIIAFVPVATIPKIIEIIKEKYDIEFNSKIELNDGGRITEYDFAGIDLIFALAIRTQAKEADLELEIAEFNKVVQSRSKCQINIIPEAHFDYIVQ